MEDAMHERVEPEGWKAPRGYANGVVVEAGARLVFVAGQIAWDGEQRLVGAGDFAAQFAQALANVVAVVRAAGGGPEHVARLTLYVTDKRAYLERQRELGVEYRRHMGRHYPAMALLEVAALLEPGALLEIEATAAIP
jgi:enamine deaminase RidA (YjgF/YER057c/UK114 family)